MTGHRHLCALLANLTTYGFSRVRLAMLNSMIRNIVVRSDSKTVCFGIVIPRKRYYVIAVLIRVQLLGLIDV